MVMLKEGVSEGEEKWGNCKQQNDQVHNLIQCFQSVCALEMRFSKWQAHKKRGETERGWGGRLGNGEEGGQW